MPAPAEKPPTKSSKSVTIHHDGEKFSVFGDGGSQEHPDLMSALRHARSIFGGHSGSEDTAMSSEGL